MVIFHRPKPKMSSRAKRPDIFFRAAVWRVGPRSRGIPARLLLHSGHRLRERRRAVALRRPGRFWSAAACRRFCELSPSTKRSSRPESPRFLRARSGGIAAQLLLHSSHRLRERRRAARFVCVFCIPVAFTGAPRALRRGRGICFRYPLCELCALRVLCVSAALRLPLSSPLP